MVLLVAVGNDVEVRATVTQSRMYQNLTNAAPLMGFYDVKNARLCGILQGQGLTYREPAMDEADFERFVKSCVALMVPGRDVMWVLGGRTQTNELKLKRVLKKNNCNYQKFHLCYNMKHMTNHFKLQRGVAKSRNHEMLYLCYLGRMPKRLAKTRAYVDVGSPVFNEVVRNVPVLSQKRHALVSREIREKSLKTMTGVDVGEVEAKDETEAHKPTEDEDTPADGATDGATAAAAKAESAEEERAATADAAQKAVVTAALKKRKLYRQNTGCEVPWFPHDNDCELLKELCHEAGRPRWVYFGTPAGGAGIHGCIEMGCSVLALCYDDHHRTHLGPFLVERAVEAMLGCDSLVFNNEVLLARAKQLSLTGKKRGKADKDTDEDKEDDEGKKNEKGKKKKKKKQSSDSDSDSNSDTKKRKKESSSDSDAKKNKKKS